MRAKRQKRSNPTWILPAALLVASSAVILALIAAFGGGGEVATSQTGTPGESPVTGQKNVVVISSAPDLATVPPPTGENEAPEPVARYAAVNMTEDERRELAAVLYLEAGNQCAEGQQAVAEVVLNRSISEGFPDTVHDVLHQGEGSTVPQFSTIGNLDVADPAAAQYDAIDAALYGPSILPEDVVFFSRGGENDRVWGTIGDHVFCYAYVWE